MRQEADGRRGARADVPHVCFARQFGRPAAYCPVKLGLRFAANADTAS